ncbi:unnamed protein product, partial [Mesorhabditis belari]|uniref:F-box domain-containing protein n=1 Tax=Mesorhabditis belari TaxID=2138241 RepID=A0AAF3ESW5_9BILA
MISVTVAAHGGRGKRVVGGNLKAYGSGRLSICDLDIPPEKLEIHQKSKFWSNLFEKLLALTLVLFQTCFPFLNRLFEKPKQDNIEARLAARRSRSLKLPPPPIQKLNAKVLLEVFSYLEGSSLVACEGVCKRWRKIIEKHVDELPKVGKDQIRILFDEGEIVIYPLDSRKTSTRYPMPNLQRLAILLRHLSTLSLFVRGLIPIEATPVLRSLCNLHLRPQQIYFIWSKFSVESISLLEELIICNAETLTDIGFEECSPNVYLSDRLIFPIVHQLQSLRIWNDAKSGPHNITDATLAQLTRNLEKGCRLETLDLTSCRVTSTAIARLIYAWALHPSSDVSITLNFCSDVYRCDVLNQLSQRSIHLQNGKLARNGCVLTISC